MTKNFKNLFISVIILSIILAVALKYCHRSKLYSDEYINRIIDAQKESDKKIKDTLELLRGQLSLKENQIEAREETIILLEGRIDTLINKHQVTKQKIKPIPFNLEDTGYVLAPNEYVDECEDCFKTLSGYKKENIQLRFERDSYDEILKSSNSIQEQRAINAEIQRNQFASLMLDCQNKRRQDSINNKGATRKLKLSAMGMTNYLLIPQAGGPGVIYEDKKFNEYGAHVLFSNAGNIYLIHIAKTISFRKK